MAQKLSQGRRFTSCVRVCRKAWQSENENEMRQKEERRRRRGMGVYCPAMAFAGPCRELGKGFQIVLQLQLSFDSLIWFLHKLLLISNTALSVLEFSTHNFSIPSLRRAHSHPHTSPPNHAETWARTTACSCTPRAARPPAHPRQTPWTPQFRGPFESRLHSARWTEKTPTAPHC